MKRAQCRQHGLICSLVIDIQIPSVMRKDEVWEKL